MYNYKNFINDFISDFSRIKDLQPNQIISILIEADGTTTYEYADLILGGIHRVQDFKRV